MLPVANVQSFASIEIVGGGGGGGEDDSLQDVSSSNAASLLSMVHPYRSGGEA